MAARTDEIMAGIAVLYSGIGAYRERAHIHTRLDCGVKRMLSETPVPVNTQLGIARKLIRIHRNTEILSGKAHSEPPERLVTEPDVGKTGAADIPDPVHLRRMRRLGIVQGNSSRELVHNPPGETCADSEIRRPEISERLAVLPCHRIFLTNIAENSECDAEPVVNAIDHSEGNDIRCGNSRLEITVGNPGRQRTAIETCFG